MKIDPKNYDYMWSNFDVNFFYASKYFSSFFRDSDIILIYNWRNKELKFFIGKKYRERVSKFAVDLYQSGFNDWKRKIIENTKKCRELEEQSKKDVGAIPDLSLEVLRKNFLERIERYRNLLDSYFYTEFFALDEVEKLAHSESEKYTSLKSNLEEMGRLKFEARRVLNLFHNYQIIFKPYTDEISRRFSRDDIEWLSIQEIIDLIDGKNIIESNRNKQFWVLAKQFDWQVVLGNEAKKIMGDFDSTLFKGGNEINEIKGITANKGVYQGRVKVLRTVFSDAVQDEVRKVEKGDVLVANTTGPEIMSACQRAGAIVTDEGSLISHAAIISRELKKPCVIGTKIATKVLKDGDLVEVDADRGIVTVLKGTKMLSANRNQVKPLCPEFYRRVNKGIVRILNKNG